MTFLMLFNTFSSLISEGRAEVAGTPGKTTPKPMCKTGRSDP